MPLLGQVGLDAERATKQRKYACKRGFDLSLLVLSHFILFPLWIMLWTLIPLAIWIGDRGPIFYRQQRAGKGGRVFLVLKFRTMVPNAHLKGPAWTLDGDPRITSIGRVLRRTALDELPELLNIWKGDMSFVGPRALDLEEHKLLEQEIPCFGKRLQVLPGLTGPAQIYDQTDDANEKLRYDVEYIENMSPWLDARLLVLSVWNTLVGRWDRRAGKTSRVNLGAKPLESKSPNSDPSIHDTLNER